MDKRLKLTNNNPIQAIWNMLVTGDVYYRAAAILLLQEYCQALVAVGKGDTATKLVQALRDADPYKWRRPKGHENRLCP
jgi:hypothetical protein